MSTTTSTTAALPFQPSSVSTAQLAAVPFLVRYSGATHAVCWTQLGRWFAWCESNGWTHWSGFSEPPRRDQHPGSWASGADGLSVNTMMHAVRGYFRFAHIDGTIPTDPTTQPATARPQESARGTPRQRGGQISFARFRELPTRSATRCSTTPSVDRSLGQPLHQAGMCPDLAPQAAQGGITVRGHT